MLAPVFSELEAISKGTLAQLWSDAVKEGVALRHRASTHLLALKCVVVLPLPPGDHFKLLRGLSVTLTSQLREPNTLDLSGL